MACPCTLKAQVRVLCPPQGPWGPRKAVSKEVTRSRVMHGGKVGVGG